MPHVSRNLDELCAALAQTYSAPAIIGIDGWTGVSKTTLGRDLAARFMGHAYDLDSALTRDQRQYRAAIRIDEVADALKRHNRLLFVSGICLRQILDDAGCGADGHIYVKRMAVWGWPDEDELAGAIDEVPGSSGESVRQELRAYHEHWHPHEIAEFEFHRQV